jgi:hypothetical protein
MKIPSKTFILAGLIGFILGVTTMQLISWRAQKHFELVTRTELQIKCDTWLFNDMISKVSESASTIAALRRHPPETVISKREEALSQAIGELIEKFPQRATNDTLCLNLLQKVARFRGEHPYQTGEAELDKTVETALAALPQHTGER